MSVTYTEAEITEALMALIAWCGNASAAVRMLKSEGKRAPSPGTLHDWSRTTYFERFNELREKYRDKLEADLANELRDVARQATEGAREAVELAREAIREKREKDPARAAANLATVASKSTDKLMTLTARPVQITESRNVEEILRSLYARGLFTLPDEPKQIDAEATESPNP